MFLPFFYQLRSQGIPVSTSEYLDLLKVLQSLTAKEDAVTVEQFYHLARNCLVKDVKHFDNYDLVFAQIFEGLLAQGSEFKSQLMDWLQEAKLKELSEEQMLNAQSIAENDLIKELLHRLETQTERHDGGNHWIGTGGTSAFGHSGYNKAGVRVGGESKRRSALAVAGERKFQNYRHDTTLNLRQIKLALKSLRQFKKSGPPKLDMKRTIRRSCDLGGEIELIYRQSRKNNLRLLLLMDVGGSMTPFTHLVNQLFSAAHQVQHFKEFKALYFHNIFYDCFYTDASLSRQSAVPLEKLFSHFPSTTRVIFVGDAYMAPYELFQMTAEKRDFYRHLFFDDTGPELAGPTAYESLQMFTRHFENCIWLNPESTRLWREMTIAKIREIVPMFELSLDGLERGIQRLR